MKKLAFGIIAVVSLALAMSMDNGLAQVALVLCFAGSLQKSGIVNWMDEINKDY